MSDGKRELIVKKNKEGLDKHNISKVNIFSIIHLPVNEQQLLQQKIRKENSHLL